MIVWRGSFLCTAASSMPIRVVTKEVKYIYELSLTLEHSMSISSPVVPGLTVATPSATSNTNLSLFNQSQRHGESSSRGLRP